MRRSRLPLGLAFAKVDPLVPNINPMKIGRYLIGLASGITFGMLFAPKKGSTLRKEMASGHKKDESGVESLKVLGMAFKEAGHEMLTEFKQLAKHEQVEAALELSKDKIRTYLDSLDDSNKEVLMSAKAKLEEFAAMATEKAMQFKKAAESGKNQAKRIVKKAKKTAPTHGKKV